MHGGNNIRYANSLVVFQKTQCLQPTTSCSGCEHWSETERGCQHDEHPRNAGRQVQRFVDDHVSVVHVGA